jgi:uncharacterized protein (DUF2141 family)
MKNRILALTLILTFFSGITYGQNNLLNELNIETSDKAFLNNANVTLVIEGVRSEKGKLVIAIFNDQESFKKRKPIKKVVLNKSEIKGTEIVFSLSPGVYGISVLDDENDNNIMDYNFFGMPKEGFGFSNYYHKGLSKPHFDAFKFEKIDGIIKKIEIRLRYM